MLESLLNHFSEDEIPEGNGIQALINKLKSIQSSPSKRHMAAIRDFAIRLGMIDAEIERIEPSRIRYRTQDNLWEAYRSVNGKRFTKCSKDKKVVMEAYISFCDENNLKP